MAIKPKSRVKLDLSDEILRCLGVSPVTQGKGDNQKQAERDGVLDWQVDALAKARDGSDGAETLTIKVSSPTKPVLGDMVELAFPQGVYGLYWSSDFGSGLSFRADEVTVVGGRRNPDEKAA